MPELSFYERRTDVLRLLEARDLLKAFRFGERSIGIQLDEHVSVEVESTGIKVKVFSPRINAAKAMAAVELVLSDLRPKQVTLASASIQYLFPVSSPFGSVVALTAQELASELKPDAQATDWAVLLDGTSAAAGSTFQVEYGMVDAEQARDRLRRRIGRMGDMVRTSEGRLPDLTDLDDLPNCAFFFDWLWTPLTLIEDGDASRVSVAWDVLVEEGERLSRKLQARFSVAEGMLSDLEA
jgi:hypothetical protein